MRAGATFVALAGAALLAALQGGAPLVASATAATAPAAASPRQRDARFCILAADSEASPAKSIRTFTSAARSSGEMLA